MFPAGETFRIKQKETEFCDIPGGKGLIFVGFVVVPGHFGGHHQAADATGSLVAMSDGIRLAFQLPPTATFSITMQDGKDLI